MKQKIVLVLADLYQVQEHNYLYEKLNFFERKQFDLICGKSATDLSCALKTLSGYLKNIISDDKLGDGMGMRVLILCMKLYARGDQPWTDYLNVCLISIILVASIIKMGG